jgi:hypothetical protein
MNTIYVSLPLTAVSFPKEVIPVAKQVYALGLIPSVEVEDATFAVAENSLEGTVIGIVTAIGTALTYAITGGNTNPDGDSNSPSFAINPTTRAITVNDSGDLDYESTNQFDLEVTVTGTGGLSDTASVTVNLTDVNEIPTAVNLTNTLTQLAENSNIGTGIKVADIAIADDNLGTNILSLTGADKDSFAIRNNALFFIGASPDFETKNKYEVTVNVDDSTVGNTPDASGNFTLNITNIEPILNDSLTRFQNSDRPGTYLFAGEEESKSIRQNFPNFREEGFAFNVSNEPDDELIVFNRFQNNAVPGTYLYAGTAESASIEQNFPNFVKEGVAFYAYDANASEGVDIYRMQNTQQLGTYIFVGEEEKNNILANFPQFQLKGVAFKVIV